MKYLVIVFVTTVFSQISILVYAENENLYVSRDVMLKNLGDKYTPTMESLYGGGCNSAYPSDWEHFSYIRYIDRVSPTFQSGFYKNEFPLTINYETFRIEQFTESNPIKIDVGKPVQIKLLLFENTGPHNIQNITIFTSYRNNNFPNETFLQLTKNPPSPVDDPIYLYAYGGIEEDQGRSYLYPNRLGNYTVQVSDPKDILSDITAKVVKVNHKMEVILEITFNQPIELSNLGIIASDADNNTIVCNVIDAIKVSNNSQYLVCHESQDILFRTVNNEKVCVPSHLVDWIIKSGWAYK